MEHLDPEENEGKEDRQVNQDVLDLMDKQESEAGLDHLGQLDHLVVLVYQESADQEVLQENLDQQDLQELLENLDLKDLKDLLDPKENEVKLENLDHRDPLGQ